MFLDSARTQYSLIDYVGSVCSCDHEDHSSIVNAIQLVEQSVDYSFSYLVALILSLGGKCIELIKENDARSRHSGSLKYFSNCLLTLSHIFIQKLWSFDCDEVSIGFIGYRFSDHRFSAARRAIEQNTSTTNFKVHGFEFLLLPQRHNDLLSQLFLDIVQGSHIFEFHMRYFGEPILFQDRLYFLHCFSEILDSDDGFIVLLVASGQGFNKCLSEKSDDIGSHISCAHQYELFDVLTDWVLVERHDFLDDFFSLIVIRVVDFELLVEHAWLAELI